MGRKIVAANSPLNGKQIVITGTLHMMKREDAIARINEHGGIVDSTVTKQTDYLIVGEKPGSVKMSASKRHAIPQLTEEQFLQMLIGKKLQPVSHKTCMKESNNTTPTRIISNNRVGRSLDI